MWKRKWISKWPIEFVGCVSPCRLGRPSLLLPFSLSAISKQRGSGLFRWHRERHHRRNRYQRKPDFRTIHDFKSNDIDERRRRVMDKPRPVPCRSLGLSIPRRFRAWRRRPYRAAMQPSRQTRRLLPAMTYGDSGSYSVYNSSFAVSATLDPALTTSSYTIQKRPMEPTWPGT